MSDLQLIPQILIKAAPTPLPPQVAPRSSKSLLHIGQGSTQLCLHGEVHLQQSGKNPISAQPPSPFPPVSEGAAAPGPPVSTSLSLRGWMLETLLSCCLPTTVFMYCTWLLRLLTATE